MKDKQNRKTEMYFKVQGQLKEGSPKWDGIPEFKNTIDGFFANNEVLTNLKKEDATDITPVLMEKINRKEILINSAVPVCSVLQVYAYDTDNENLAKKLGFTAEKLSKVKDSELISKCKTIWKSAKTAYDKSVKTADKLIVKNKKEKVKESIHSYGLTQDMIEELKKNIKRYIDSVLQLRDSISYLNKCRKQINKMVKANDNLLNYKLDKLITLFETTDKEFVKKYRESRVITEKESRKDDKKDKKQKAKMKEQQAVTKKPVAEKAEKAENKEKTKLTNEIAGTVESYTEAEKTTAPETKSAETKVTPKTKPTTMKKPAMIKPKPITSNKSS
ncbi:MAG: hypothetical protein JXB49_18845 [Bacteroidales bacterium]|nr:hypothetical protein [Bacteroidales bacterium]